MADTKISDLTSITGADTAADDDFVVVDTSAAQTKRITRAQLALGLFPGIDDNATAEALALSNTIADWGQSGSGFSHVHSAADQSQTFSGGSGATAGSNILMFGATHASYADDMWIRRSGVRSMIIDGPTGDISFMVDNGSTVGTIYDASLSDWRFDDAAGAEYMRFDSSAAALLIGATTPSASELLRVAGDSRIEGDIISTPSASVTPANNGDMVVEATSNTTLTFKLKGSDGTVRSGTLTLS